MSLGVEILGSIPADAFSYSFFQCGPNEFTCKSGERIPLERRCDGIADCNGNYDEKNCTLIKADEDLYQKEKSPFGKNGKVTEVVVHVTILDFGAVDEIEQSFQLRFFLQLRWYEHQLIFYLYSSTKEWC